MEKVLLSLALSLVFTTVFAGGLCSGRSSDPLASSNEQYAIGSVGNISGYSRQSDESENDYDLNYAEGSDDPGPVKNLLQSEQQARMEIMEIQASLFGIIAHKGRIIKAALDHHGNLSGFGLSEADRLARKRAQEVRIKKAEEEMLLNFFGR